MSLSRPLVSVRDIKLTVLLLAGIPIVSLMPRKACLRLVPLLERLGIIQMEQPAAVDRMAAYGGLERCTVERILRDRRRERLISSVLFARALLRGPKERIDVIGKEHIDAALAAGKGCVLWIADFVHAGSASKIALHQLHYQVSHVSRPEHGFSSTLYGVHLLNKVRTGYEMRFLRERIVHDRNNPARTSERVRERLGENQIVSILASGYEGRSLVTAPFLKGSLSMAAGAPAAAFNAGAELLPVFVRPSAEPGAMTVVVEQPVRMDRSDKRTAVATAVQDYFSRLEREVMRQPELWRAWNYLSCPADEPATPCGAENPSRPNMSV